MPTKSVWLSGMEINTLSSDVWFVRIGQYLAEMQLLQYIQSEGKKN